MVTLPFLSFSTLLPTSFSPAGTPNAFTVYGVPFVGTSKPSSASVFLTYSPCSSTSSTGDTVFHHAGSVSIGSFLSNTMLALFVITTFAGASSRTLMR